MTTRRLMIAVAVVAVLSAGAVSMHHRSIRFLDLASRHQRRVAEAREMIFVSSMRELLKRNEGIGPVSFEGTRHWGLLADYHKRMELKYRRAARYPWLPVAFDPPVPK
jgi:hypothetical protein